jgi:long-subunit acyl-CoA synthetase (AMP-forming)
MRRSFKHIHFPSYRPSFSNISIRKNQEGKFSSDSNKYHYDTPNISPYADFSFNTLSELQSKACTLYESNPMLGTKSIDNKSFEWLTYGDFGRKVEKFRGVLRDLNVGYGDKVAIISNNRTEWAISMYATVSIGGQFVPMYEAQLEKDWRYIIEDSGAKLLIVANDSIFAKVQSYQGSVGAPIQNILVLDCDADKEHSFHRLMASSAIPKSSTLAYEKLQSSDIATSQ